MEVFKITRDTFARQLTASGRANRWNLEDEFVVYTGGSRSPSTLELIVHKNAINPLFTYKVMIISIADDENLLTNILKADLPESWRSMGFYPLLQQLGSKWYRAHQSLMLRVPSSIITNEYNYIINVKHPDFKEKVSLVRTEDYFWDDRLL